MSPNIFFAGSLISSSGLLGDPLSFNAGYVMKMPYADGTLYEKDTCIG